MTTLSPLAQRAVDRMGFPAPLPGDSAFTVTLEGMNKLVASVESLVLNSVYGDIPKPADDFQRQLDMLAEAHGARLAVLECAMHTHAD